MATAFSGLYDGVNSVDASSAARRFERRAAAAGERLLQAGTPGDELVGVVEGSLEVRRGGTVLGVAGPGNLVGELALFEAQPRTADVVARVPSEVLVVSRGAYEELRDTAHPVAANLERLVLEQQAARLREMDDRIARLAEGKARPMRLPGRDFFARVAAEFGRGGSLSATVVDRVAAFRASGLVPDIPEEVLAGLAERFAVRACGAGQLLCVEGSPADGLWLVESGAVDVLLATGEDEVQTVATVGPGALIGGAALVDGGQRMASCVASGRVVGLFLDGAGWRGLAQDATLHGSALRRAVIRAMAGQLAGANAMVEDFERERARRALGQARSRLVASRPPDSA